MQIVSRNASTALKTLAAEVLNTGELVHSRNGDALELTGVRVTLLHPDEREILIRERKANVIAQIAESMWVLAGRNDVEWLGHYLPRARDFSDDGATWRGAYGPRIRRWARRGDPHDVVDQLRYVVDQLRQDPLTRRAVITLWDPDVDTSPGLDIPCNNWLAFSIRKGALNLEVGIRSNDLIWGWSGINAFEWSFLQEIVASLTNSTIGTLSFTISSLHIYRRHWERAKEIASGGVHEEYRRGYSGNRRGRSTSVDELDQAIGKWFILEEKIRAGENVDSLIYEFPEPLLRSWLYALRAWWRGDSSSASPSNRLDVAMGMIPKSLLPSPPEDSSEEFTSFLAKLHEEKSAAYGDSWRRRGETLGILANIARKVDRLGVAGGGDTSADTAIDLLIYLVKYGRWLVSASSSDNPLVIGRLLRDLKWSPCQGSVQEDIEKLRKLFDSLEAEVARDASAKLTTAKIVTIEHMIRLVTPVAHHLWLAEKTPAGHAERNATRSWNPEA